MRTSKFAVALFCLFAAGWGSGFVVGEKVAEKQAPQLFELRTYTTHEGKLDDLHARFKNHTMQLFERHGMKNIGYWVPADQENTLIYIVAHADEAAAKKAWNGFRTDAEWKAAFAESRKDGPLVKKVESQYMTATEYSPMK